MKKTLLQEVKAMNRIAGTQMTKEQEIAFIKNRLDEFMIPFAGRRKQRKETPEQKAKRLALAKKNKDLRDKFEKMTVLNPETGRQISVKTALGYPATHPARKAANALAGKNGLKGYESDMDDFYKDRKKEYDKLKADYENHKNAKGLKAILNKINIFDKTKNPDDDAYWQRMQKQFKYLSDKS